MILVVFQLAVVGDGKENDLLLRYQNAPNGLTYPPVVTPPDTPDNSTAQVKLSVCLSEEPLDFAVEA